MKNWLGTAMLENSACSEVLALLRMHEFGVRGSKRIRN
jgi:hypothetical protein